MPVTEITRKPWVVAVWRVKIGPGAANNPPFVDSVHVFHSEEAFKAATEAALSEGKPGRWMHVYNGDPRGFGHGVEADDWQCASDRVFWHDDMPAA